MTIAFALALKCFSLAASLQGTPASVTGNHTSPVMFMLAVASGVRARRPSVQCALRAAPTDRKQDDTSALFSWENIQELDSVSNAWLHELNKEAVYLYRPRKFSCRCRGDEKLRDRFASPVHRTGLRRKGTRAPQGLMNDAQESTNYEPRVRHP
nr:uncharacterized protein LOC126543837 [Dermacentor andersoni]